jgi:hypothetical protein
MTIKQQRNIKILKEIEYNRSRIKAAREKFAQATNEEQESQVFKAGMERVEVLQAETDKMEADFLQGTIKLKPGRRASEDLGIDSDLEDNPTLSNERRQICIDNLNNRLAVLKEQLETRELELESLRLNLRLKERDFAKRVADIKAKIDGTVLPKDL